MEDASSTLCNVCHTDSGRISKALGVCRACILDRWDEARPIVEEAHRSILREYGLPFPPPSQGLGCGQCVNLCRLGAGQVGPCGVRGNVAGSVASRVEGAVLEAYYDPLPTNCVADFVCPAGTGSGFPRYARRPGPEFGYKNLAVFYGACNFSCLYCQNWRFRELGRRLHPVVRAEELASWVDDRTTCVCFFGGDPTPQIQHALDASRIARRGRDLLRICFETNGSMNPAFVREMADIVYESGGCIKFDLKAWDDRMNRALSGASNRFTLRNFRWLSRYAGERGDRGVPFLVASTLLVPGYVEEDEVRSIAHFIASLDPGIPYSLLAFAPCFKMTEMPLIDRDTVERCVAAAREAGLERIHVGNAHLIA